MIKLVLDLFKVLLNKTVGHGLIEILYNGSKLAGAAFKLVFNSRELFAALLTSAEIYFK